MIEVKGLVKTYGTKRAVDGVSFTVRRGDILGFLGPNGAGKSTTMKMITGYLRPDAGTATVDGIDVIENPVAVKRKLGYLPESAPAYGEMTVGEFLGFIAEVRGFRAKDARQAQVDRALALTHLEGVRKQTIETLSKGFKQRVGLAQALLHDPPVLILDEPTDGLDPNQKHEVRRLINELSKDKLVIVSTHILEEVHEVCTRAIVIANGRIVADDTPTALESRSRYHNAVSLRFEKPDELGAAVRELAALPQVEAVESDARELRLTAIPKPGAAALPAVSALIARNNWDVPELHLEAGRLDEVFRTLTRAPADSMGGVARE